MTVLAVDEDLHLTLLYLLQLVTNTRMEITKNEK